MSDEAPVIGEIDKEAILRKYLEERDKRLRPDGNDQYIRLAGGPFADYLTDPHTPQVDREPLTDHVTVAVIGGGFAGLVNGARLKEAGFDDVRIVEKGGDFGGTWYWNRYPGAMCDTASMVYMPLLEETGHMPTEKYAHGPEILEHSQRIGKHFGLYEGALFHTQVTDLTWDDAESRWVVSTNRGDRFTAQYVAMGIGPLHVAKLPGIPGIADFRGHSFHTSRWDYAYTGGDNLGATMDGLADKRVAIIGTGATSVQAIPQLARDSRELYVFQRTPSSVDVRDNGPIDPEWFAGIATPGWQRRWTENFTAVQTGFTADQDLVMDGWTEIARRMLGKIKELPPDERTPLAMMTAFEDSDFEKMEQIRARVDTLVADHETAQALKAWYRQLCKRPCFHDEYLQSFNLPGVHLVDTDGKGVEKITERGVVVAGREYEVDCIIYASGFEVGTDWTWRSGYEVTGRDGVKISDYWADGMRSLHGIHVHGFPNMFLIQPTQGANLIANIPHGLTDTARTLVSVLRHAVDVGAREVEVTRDAEDAWVDLLLSGPGRMGVIGSLDCTPGYYNNEGRDPGPRARLNVGHPKGPIAYFSYIDEWRTNGKFEGVDFR